MLKSTMGLLGIALVSGSLLICGTARAQSQPEATAASEQKIEAATPNSSSQEISVAERPEAASSQAGETQVAIEKAENSNLRVPCASRIFPSLMQ